MIEHGDCTRCGCPEARVIRAGLRWGREWQKLRCANCGHVWTLTEPWTAKTDRIPPPEAPGVATNGENADAAGPTAEPTEGQALTYHLVRCPACQSDNTRISSTRRPVRYHRCLDCGETFKSVER